MKIELKELDKVEITTLQDNYIEMTTLDDNQMITRAMPLAGIEIKNSILSEFGFSTLVKTTEGNHLKTLLFDFGFSQEGAALNAQTLGIDMSQVDAVALSHSHIDHIGGLEQLLRLIRKRDLEFVVHPAAFRDTRYMKYGEELKIYFPRLSRDIIERAGFRIIETKTPYSMLNGHCLFLGEIERQTDFEKGSAIAHYEDNGVEKWDANEDDTAVVFNVKGRGLIILTGCGHAGIVNTVLKAKAVTGISKIHVIMGGFHLSGPLTSPLIEKTTAALKEINPDYIIPTHCTGRKATMYIEKEMPRQFILNMSGTKLSFTA